MKFTTGVILAACTLTVASAFVVGGIDNQRRLSTSSLKMSMEEDALNFAKSEIDSADVVVFSKTFCPFCKKTKELFAEKNIDAKIIELDQRDDTSLVQNALKDLTGQRSVPNVFIKGQHLGGNDDTQAANKSGKLDEMLAA